MNPTRPRWYAILPAAGSSTRMGEPKLCLPWPTATRPEGTVLDQVLQTWTGYEIAILIVVRADDTNVKAICGRWPVKLVQTDTMPADMKASVQIGLQTIDDCLNPQPGDGCFIAPADLPGLRSEVIERMLGVSLTEDLPIAVPNFAGKVGHPVLMRYSATRDISELAADEGIDRLVKHGPSSQLHFAAELAAKDIDTPEDYEREWRSFQNRKA